MSRNRLYILLLAACFTGYFWLAISFYNNLSHRVEFGICFFKHVTNIPCPSCGSTRSILAFLNGNFLDALYWNPIGLLLIVIMVASPILIVYDFLRRKATFYNLYKKTEIQLQRKWVAIPSIMLVLVNWVWNIYKGL